MAEKPALTDGGFLAAGLLLEYFGGEDVKPFAYGVIGAAGGSLGDGLADKIKDKLSENTAGNKAIETGSQKELDMVKNIALKIQQEDQSSGGSDAAVLMDMAQEEVNY